MFSKQVLLTLLNRHINKEIVIDLPEKYFEFTPKKAEFYQEGFNDGVKLLLEKLIEEYD